MHKSSADRWTHVLPELNKEKFYIIHHPIHKRVDSHSHLFFELTYILSGTVEHTIDGKTSVLNAGDYFLVDYGSIHSYRTQTDKSFSNLDCLFLPELLDPALKGSEHLCDVFEHYLLHFNMQVLAQNPSQLIFHDSDGKIKNILEKIRQEAEGHAPGYTELIRCYLIEILLMTVRRIKNASVASETHTISAFLTDYVANHYMEEISLTGLSANMNYSLPHVSKCFKEETGTSFIRYLQNYRIKQASRLLLSTNKSLNEVAELVGYHDVKFFSEIFKNTTGHSPIKFRKIYNKGLSLTK